MLAGVKALGTKFRRVNFTGACIANWQINSDTQFRDISCNYIYLDFVYRNGQGLPRRKAPETGIFESFEFEFVLNQYFNVIGIMFQERFPQKDISGHKISKTVNQKPTHKESKSPQKESFNLTANLSEYIENSANSDEAKRQSRLQLFKEISQLPSR